MKDEEGNHPNVIRINAVFVSFCWRDGAGV